MEVFLYRKFEQTCYMSALSQTREIVFTHANYTHVIFRNKMMKLFLFFYIVYPT